MKVDLNAHLTRQFDLIPMDVLTQKIEIIGCGAIGSFVALNLAKMGATNICAWDPDTVSIENMSCQFFRFDDIGNNKALALKDLVKSFTGAAIGALPIPFDPGHAEALEGIVIAAVDDMKVRRQILESCGNRVRYLIDPRMSAEFYAQYCIDPIKAKDVEMYRKTLYSNEEAVQERCTAKSTIYTATLAAGLVVKTVKDLLVGKPYPRTIQWDISAVSNPLLMYPGNVEVGQ
jgi:molybdopterin/thiamine biosynthesis adenylyltransferase